MISQRQADEASQICDRALSIIEKIQRDFDEMKKAADEFNARMEEQEDRMGALAPAITSLIDGYEADLVQHRAEINRLRKALKQIAVESYEPEITRLVREALDTE